MATTFVHQRPQDLYLLQLKRLLSEGDRVTVKGNTTIELLNVTTHLEKPTDTCIIIDARRWNPWLAMSEGLWILAGRNDVAALKPYNSMITDFSDDGRTLYGAYGKRMYPQIDRMIERLKAEPSDRRAVLQIWNQLGYTNDDWTDLATESKDPPCLAGGTLVYSPEGNMPIKDLVGKRIPVYTLNEETKKIEFKWAEGVGKGTKPTIKVTFDDGSVITATPDHLFLIKSRKGTGDKRTVHQWVKASELQPESSIVPIHFVEGRKGHICYFEDVTSNWAGNNRKAVHREYWKFLYGEQPDGYDVHHDNHIKIDNRAENLVLEEHGYHSQHHKSTAFGKLPKDRAGFRKTRPDKKDWSIEELLDLGQHLLTTEGKLTWGRFNKTYKGIASGTVIQTRFGSWSNFVSAVVGNHKVVSIKTGEEEEVFDLQVEENHNFFIAPGILVHNCNDMVMFKLRQGKLHMTVLNRSNDIHWGLYAVNLPTFQMLQQYIAARLGVKVGTQTHFSNSLHVYTGKGGPGPKADVITAHMTDELDGPVTPEHYPSHDLMFQNLQHFNHPCMDAYCSAVLEYTTKMKTGDPPFFFFAQEFLKMYRERDWKPELLPFKKEFADWVKAGDIFVGRVWNVRD